MELSQTGMDKFICKKRTRPSSPRKKIYFLNATQSSRNCSIGHFFCSFSYSRVYSNHIKLSSDVINCRRKKLERKSTLPPLLIHFVCSTLCSHLQCTHFSKRIFKRIFLFHLLFQKVPVST